MMYNKGRPGFSSQGVQHLQFCYAETEDLVYLSFHWLPWHLADLVCSQTAAALHLAAHPPEAKRINSHVTKLAALNTSVFQQALKKPQCWFKGYKHFNSCSWIWVKFNQCSTELLQVRKYSFNRQFKCTSTLLLKFLAPIFFPK